MRARLVLVTACLAAAGCGGGDDPPAQRALVPVVLDVREPADEAVVRTDSVRVAGSVAPAGAAVRVNGSVAEVEGDEFVADVPLEPGANVIDVIASARGRAPALTAVRVTRELPVEVPDVEGLAVEEAESRLADAGLKSELEDDGGFFDELLPGEPAVCGQDPQAGTEVRRGTAVLLTVAKRC
ncbi:MAG TPA: PASTA domain-containing protein [Solirubrobacteraceae bacterium]|nr:PASTA domain-containing protein [Solirubrobacteraceae bacterium]